MKLTQESSEGVTLISAYDPASVTVAGQTHAGSVLVTPAGGAMHWPVAGFAALEAGHFASVVDQGPAVVLIGTGARQHFPAPAVLRPLVEARIGFEVMDTGSACRTYNLLAAEGRKVLAALIVEGAAR